MRLSRKEGRLIVSNCAVKSSDLMQCGFDGLAVSLTSDAFLPKDAIPENSENQALPPGKHSKIKENATN